MGNTLLKKQRGNKMRQIAARWNWDKKCYNYCSVPELATKYTENLESIIQCANCEKYIKAGDTYTSKEIHDLVGFGWLVCPVCYERELERERKTKGE